MEESISTPTPTKRSDPFLQKIIAQRLANTFYAMEAGQEPEEDQPINAGEMDLAFDLAAELIPWFRKAWNDGASATVVAFVNNQQIAENPYV